MKNLFLVAALVVGFSATSMAATVKFTACANYSKDAKVLISIQDEKLIDMTVYYLTEAGAPAQALMQTTVVDKVAVPASSITQEVTDFLIKFGVNDVTGGTSYAATTVAHENLIFDVLAQKAGGKAVMVSYNDNLVFIGSSLNCH